MASKTKTVLPASVAAALAKKNAPAPAPAAAPAPAVPSAAEATMLAPVDAYIPAALPVIAMGGAGGPRYLTTEEGDALQARIASLEAALAAKPKGGRKPSGGKRGAGTGAAKLPRPDGGRARTHIKTPNALLAPGTSIYTKAFEHEYVGQWYDGKVSVPAGQPCPQGPTTLSNWAKALALHHRPEGSTSLCSRNGWDWCYIKNANGTTTLLSDIRRAAIVAALPAAPAAPVLADAPATAAPAALTPVHTPALEALEEQQSEEEASEEEENDDE